MLTATIRPRHHRVVHACVDSCNNAPYIGDMEFDDDLDATGLLCPLPVLKARKRLKALAKGQVLRVLADDPAAVVDVPHFCAEQGHVLIESDLDVEPQVYFIKKSA